jgi:hypothetical protein
MLKITDNESDDVLLIVLQMANNLFGISYKNLDGGILTSKPVLSLDPSAVI